MEFKEFRRGCNSKVYTFASDRCELKPDMHNGKLKLCASESSDCPLWHFRVSIMEELKIMVSDYSHEWAGRKILDITHYISNCK